ncbi:MAG: type II toxin-antitoxin system RelE/ParE family toxin [Mesorhizobium sp.]|nr:type II toxin-antitoxin system RelE/ParE family toxin [Mesorhizobium sp.]
MIRSFADRDTERLFHDERVRRFSGFERPARRKLFTAGCSEVAGRSGVPPVNRLERLKGDRNGQHSIRINDQFRLCFVWSAGGAEDVEIVDYH